MPLFHGQFREDSGTVRISRALITSRTVLAVVWDGLHVRDNVLQTFGVSRRSGSLATLRSSPRREDPDVVDFRTGASQRPSSRHPATDRKKKTNYNVEWHDVVSLLQAVGSIEERHDDMFLFRIGEETEVLRRPRDKDIDGQQLVKLRRILTSAGYDTVAAELQDKGRRSLKMADGLEQIPRNVFTGCTRTLPVLRYAGTCEDISPSSSGPLPTPATRHLAHRRLGSGRGSRSTEYERDRRLVLPFALEVAAA